MFMTYFEQLVLASNKHRVSLKDACVQSGVAATTLARWRQGQFAPSEKTARCIYAQILKNVEQEIDNCHAA